MKLHIEADTLICDESGNAIAAALSTGIHPTEADHRQAIINANIIIACVNAMPNFIIDSIELNVSNKLRSEKDELDTKVLGQKNG